MERGREERTGERTDGRWDVGREGRANGRTDGRTKGGTDGGRDGRTDGRTVGRRAGETGERTEGRTNERTDGRTNGRTDERRERRREGDGKERTDGEKGQVDGQTVGRTNGRTNGRTGGRTDGRTDLRMDGRTDEWMDGRTDGRTNERTDGRTDGRVGPHHTDGQNEKRKIDESKKAFDSCNRSFHRISFTIIRVGRPPVTSRRYGVCRVGRLEAAIVRRPVRSFVHSNSEEATRRRRNSVTAIERSPNHAVASSKAIDRRTVARWGKVRWSFQQGGYMPVHAGTCRTGRPAAAEAIR